MQSFWFGDKDEDGVFRPFKGDIQESLARIKELSSLGYVVLAEPGIAIEAGMFNDRREYLSALRKICFAHAEEKIKDYYSQEDLELVQMVRMLDEMDNVINLMTERATEWYLVRKPGFSRKYKNIPAKKMLGQMKRETGTGLGYLAGHIEKLADERTRLMKAISAMAGNLAPNCSELVGGLVAARLISRAGSLKELSALPSSSIQVIGAESALFTHMRAKTPPPKHGIIFQHRRVHNAPRPVRGKVARVLAGKLAIAAKIDYYTGSYNEEFICGAQERIDRTLYGADYEKKAGDKDKRGGSE
jgi:nucleolar protein 56